MNRFLRNIAEIYYHNLVENEEDGLTLSQVLFIFPNRRAGLFFRNELRALANKNIFAPNVTDINKLAESLAPYQKANDIELLVELYKSYSKIRGNNTPKDEPIETFDAFIGFGTTLLSDFDEIDKYLINTSLLFQNIADIKNTTDYSQYFSETQIKALESFWNHVNTGDKETLTFKKDFISLWDDMQEIYTTFKNSLVEKNIAYEGMIYRYVAEEILDGLKEHDFKRYVFIGFNSLTSTEEKIMNHFLNNGMGDYYFDYPTQYSEDSAFMTTVAKNYEYNLKKFKSKYEYLQETECRMPEISLHGTPSVTNQAQIAANILDELHQENPEIAKTTAILLSDESVLPTLLQTIPNYVKKLNVTMGYPLNLAPISSLIDSIITLQTEITEDKKGNKQFYHKPLINILTHPYIQKQYNSLSCIITNHITRYNYIKITEEKLKELINATKEGKEEQTFFNQLFTAIEKVEDLFEYLDNILNLIQQQYTKTYDTEEKGNAPINSYHFELEYIFQYQKYLKQLRNCLRNNDIKIEKKTLSSLIARITGTLKVQFKGEPLQGLQLMGMLEGRLIDFENIILLGFNDDKIPGNKPLNSLIPYNLRCAYELPTYENNDAIFAYNFYRMLYHAQKVAFVYDSRKEGAKNEISRFYYQLNYLMPKTIGKDLNLKHILYNLPLTPKEGEEEKEALVIEKTKDIMDILNIYKSKEEELQDIRLSASRLNDYINCPLKFYFSTIAKIGSPNEINETIQANLFGSIFHKAMEICYTNNKTAPDLKDEEILDIVTKAFHEEEKNSNEITGFNRLTLNILCKFVKATINFDKQRLPFKYIDSEKYISGSFDDVKFKGYIDRIDEDFPQHGDKVHIIDYKTSIKEKAELNLIDLFTSTQSINHEICQILLYCHLYQNLKDNAGKKIKPNLYKVYSLAKQKNGIDIELPNIKIKVPVSLTKNPMPDINYSLDVLELEDTVTIEVSEYRDIKDAYEWMLHKTLSEMFDPNIPFTTNPRDKRSEACTYCPYIVMCDKEKEVKMNSFK